MTKPSPVNGTMLPLVDDKGTKIVNVDSFIALLTSANRRYSRDLQEAMKAHIVRAVS